MSREAIDQMWQKAMRQSIEDNEMFTRYHFEALVRADEREALQAEAEADKTIIEYHEATIKHLREALNAWHEKTDWVQETAQPMELGMHKADVLKQRIDNLNKAEQQAPDYAWPTIADYEKEVGFEVNIAFRSAWAMARTTNDLFKQMGETK
jgi:hypothetical protein